MPPVGLTLYSEPYSPSGNMAANGIRKLLGAPRLDLLQTVVRESVQNCCDAAKSGKGPKVRFRLRRLSTLQLTTLRTRVLTDLPDHAETSDPVRDFLCSEQPWVLEISDFGTTGLTGPTRADVPAADGERTDFVNFIRDIGTRRDTEQGGGTYGFGKSALYLASSCSLIIVDTETRCAGQPVRRLIGAQLGETHYADHEGEQKRYTGRHWWGVQDENEYFAEPLESELAVEMARDLGMAERLSGDTGTSIMIIDPQFVDDNIENVVGAIQESLLWNFWPRMMSDVPAWRKLDVTIELDGEIRPIPSPEDVPPLDLFCDAMRGIRNGDLCVQKVESKRPAATLGQLNIVKGFKGERIPMRSDNETLFPETCRHIAVMRPVELVVRYFDDGDPLPQPGFEWAGVFVCSEDPNIEKAFADAEPPAHDDWQPEMLPNSSWARRYVGVALSRIKDAARAVAGGQLAEDTGQRDGPSLGHVADLFGKALGSTNRQGGGPRTRSPGGGGGGARQGFSISRPIFERLDDSGDEECAVFKAEIRNESDHHLVLQLQPHIVVEGGSSADVDDERKPRVIYVRSDEGVVSGEGEAFQIGKYVGELVISISLPDDGAVTVKAKLVERAEK